MTPFGHCPFLIVAYTLGRNVPIKDLYPGVDFGNDRVLHSNVGGPGHYAMGGTFPDFGRTGVHAHSIVGYAVWGRAGILLLRPYHFAAHGNDRTPDRRLYTAYTDLRARPGARDPVFCRAEHPALRLSTDGHAR